MAHIVEFTIKGLCGRKQEINIMLDRHINVIFGENGSGKTALLKILHSAMSCDETILRDVPFTEAEVVIHSIDNNRDYVYQIKKENQFISKTKVQKNISKASKATGILARDTEEKSIRAIFQQQLSFQENWSVTPATNTRGWKHTYLPVSRLYVGSGAVAYNRPEATKVEFSEDNLDARFSEILQQIWMKYSYNVNSEVREAQENGLANILREILSPIGITEKNNEKIALNPEFALERVKNFLSRQKKKVPLNDKEFLKRYKLEGEMRSVVIEIDEVEKNIEKAISPIEKLDELVKQLFSNNKKVNFSGREIEIVLGDGQLISPQQLSSGEKHLLKLLIEVVAVNLGTAIIDEPELSMHIDWQKNLLSNMCLLNENAQLIVATHSPEIMSRINDEQIFRL